MASPHGGACHAEGGASWRGSFWTTRRGYGSSIGRFIQPDTIIPNPADPQGWNRYSYVQNAPTLHNDPSGHWLETALDIAFIGYDIYDISQNGLNWENGLSLGADIICAALPIATGGGLAVRAAAHADDVLKAASRVDGVTRLASGADNLADVAQRAPIVIGENLNRVKDFASRIGAEY